MPRKSYPTTCIHCGRQQITVLNLPDHPANSQYERERQRKMWREWIDLTNDARVSSGRLERLVKQIEGVLL